MCIIPFSDSSTYVLIFSLMELSLFLQKADRNRSEEQHSMLDLSNRAEQLEMLKMYYMSRQKCKKIKVIQFDHK